jgi:hypothetical protein
MSYTMDYAEAAQPGDEVVEDKDVRVFIDPKALLFLLGTEMDFQTTKLSSGFVFNNPNQTSACGCGESVAITPAKLDALADASARDASPRPGVYGRPEARRGRRTPVPRGDASSARQAIGHGSRSARSGAGLARLVNRGLRSLALRWP